LYRTFIDGPVNGEPAVYEELYHLAVDPDETTNLADSRKHANMLETMRQVWAKKIKEARGKGRPQVLRYTKDSMLESGKPVVHE